MRLKRIFKYIPIVLGLYFGLVLGCWFGLADYADITTKIWWQLSAVTAIALTDILVW